MAEATISPARRLPRKANNIGNDQQRAFQQVRLDGVENLVDQVRCGRTPFQWSHLVASERRNVFHALIEPCSDLVAVFAHQHEAQPENNLALSVGGCGGAADFVADVNVGHVADAGPEIHRLASTMSAIWSVLVTMPTPCSTRTLAAALQISAAHVEIVFLECLGELLTTSGSTL